MVQYVHPKKKNEEKRKKKKMDSVGRSDWVALITRWLFMFWLRFPADFVCCVHVPAYLPNWCDPGMVQQGKEVKLLVTCTGVRPNRGLSRFSRPAFGRLSHSLGPPARVALFLTYAISRLRPCLVLSVCRAGNVGWPLRRVAKHGGASSWQTPLDFVQTS